MPEGPRDNIVDFASFRKKKEAQQLDTPNNTSEVNVDPAAADGGQVVEIGIDQVIEEIGKHMQLEHPTAAAELMPIFSELILSDRSRQLEKFTEREPDSSVRKYDTVVNSYSNQDLVVWFRNSTERDWARKPAFYRAIVQEMKRRLPELKK